MYNEQIESLITLALADGELTEKEKQVLFKKAEAAGIDLDEFEMVLDAKLFEKNKSKNDQPITAAPKSDKFGDIKKCPACGSMIASFSAKCSDCGHEFSNIQANVSITGLFNLLNKIDEEERNRKKSFFDTSSQMEETINKRKGAAINSYPIPTTKSDILEFVSQAVPQAKLSFKQKFNPLSKLSTKFDPDMILKNAWRDKLHQIILKARFSLKEDKGTLDQIENYANEIGIK